MRPVRRGLTRLYSTSAKAAKISSRNTVLRYEDFWANMSRGSVFQNADGSLCAATVTLAAVLIFLWLHICSLVEEVQRPEDPGKRVKHRGDVSGFSRNWN